jgi:hypothetical protein
MAVTCWLPAWPVLELRQSQPLLAVTSIALAVSPSEGKGPHAVNKASGMQSDIKAQSILVQRGHKCMCKVLAARQPAWASEWRQSWPLLVVPPTALVVFTWKGEGPAVNTQ